MYKGSLPDNHILVRVYRKMESLLYFIADYHLCVSEALKKWLKVNFRIQAKVVFDRPGFNFVAGNGLRLELKHNLLMKLELTESLLFPSVYHYCEKANEELSIHTRKASIEEEKEEEETKIQASAAAPSTKQSRSGSPTTELVSLRADRNTALIVTSTSWTPDEDMNMLINAVRDLDEHMSNKLKVVVVITGKGPLKTSFESVIQEVNLQLHHCVIRTLWLEPEEYPQLLACADIGVCLHTSSSGLDLPMKVLDMFGSGVPVCAVAYPAISELVVNGINGIVFKDAFELSSHLMRLLADYPKDLEELNRMRKNILKTESWEENWSRECAPCIQKALRGNLTYGLARNRLFLLMIIMLFCFFFSLETVTRLIRNHALAT